MFAFQEQLLQMELPMLKYLAMKRVRPQIKLINIIRPRTDN